MAKKVILKVASPYSGDPVKGDIEGEKMLLSKNKPQIDLNIDLRDRLAELVGKGNTLSSDDKAAIYGNLVATLGKDKAQKVLNHTFIFNSRPDVQKLPIEEKLKAFYTMGSNDPDVMEMITRTKNLGYGILPGFRGSSSFINQQLSGRIPTTEIGAVNPELQRKVMLKVKK